MDYVSTWMGDRLRLQARYGMYLNQNCLCNSCVSDGCAARACILKDFLALFNNVAHW